MLYFTTVWLAQLVEHQSAVLKVEGSSPRLDQHSAEGLKIIEENMLPL